MQDLLYAGRGARLPYVQEADCGTATPEVFAQTTEPRQQLIDKATRAGDAACQDAGEL